VSRARRIGKRLTAESISGAFPFYGGPTIFPFSRSNQRSEVLATFDLRLSHPFSRAAARSPGAIVGDFANPIERPFFHSLRLLPATPRDVSVPFARLPSAFFLRLWRFLSIDITGSRSREPRNSERANNSCDFSTGCFCTSATPPSCHSADSSPRGRRRRTTVRRQRRILRSRKRKGEMREIILGMVPARARAADTSIIERISSPPRSRSKNGDRSLRGDVLLTPDCV